MNSSDELQNVKFTDSYEKGHCMAVYVSSLLRTPFNVINPDFKAAQRFSNNIVLKIIIWTQVNITNNKMFYFCALRISNEKKFAES